MELLTKRLRLRAYTEGDAPAFAAMNADPELMRWLGGPRDRARSISEMAYNNATLAGSSYGKVAVERRSDGAFLGMCGLSVEDWYPDDLEIGWRLLRCHWGFGYATEAASAWLGHAFRDLGVARVISISDAPNQRSISVMKRLNMKLDHTAELMEGDHRFDCVVHAITRSDFDRAAHPAPTVERQGRP